MRGFLFFLPFLATLLSITAPARAVVEVPCEFHDGLIWLRVEAGGASPPLAFVLDSGAGASILDLKSARRLGLPMGERERVLGVHTVTSAWRIGNFQGRIGTLPAPASLLAMDLASVRGASGRKLDGLLGLDFLRQHIVQVDYASRRVRFSRRGEISPSGERLPLLVRNDALSVRAMVNGAPRLLRLDTGCTSPLEVFNDRKFARRQISASIALSANRRADSVADVQLGSQFHAKVPAGLHAERLFPGEDGLLGNGLLSRFAVTIDASGKALFLRERSPGQQ